MSKAYKISKAGLVEGPNCAPFRVHDEFNHEDLCDMLNECHDYAMRTLDSRLHEVCLEREQARTERNYERQRYQDSEGVWLATRDANRLLAERLRRTEKLLREVCHYATGFIVQIEQQPEFGPQPKYGNGMLGMTWRTAEEAMRFLDKKDAAEAQRTSSNDPERQGEARA